MCCRPAVYRAGRQGSGLVCKRGAGPCEKYRSADTIYTSLQHCISLGRRPNHRRTDDGRRLADRRDRCLVATERRSWCCAQCARKAKNPNMSFQLLHGLYRGPLFVLPSQQTWRPWQRRRPAQTRWRRRRRQRPTTTSWRATRPPAATRRAARRRRRRKRRRRARRRRRRMAARRRPSMAPTSLSPATTTATTATTAKVAQDRKKERMKKERKKKKRKQERKKEERSASQRACGGTGSSGAFACPIIHAVLSYFMPHCSFTWALFPFAVVPAFTH